jgi:tetratricopeptide (TPR) repeat protein
MHPFHPSLPIPRRTIGLALLAATWALALACYDENAFESMTLSPDGRWLAVSTARHELGILDLEAPESPFTIYSNYADAAVAWNPNSTRLAFVEQNSGQPCSLWLLDPRAGRQAEALSADLAWKAHPAWISNERLAYLSDRGAEDVNVWTYDLPTRRSELVIDRPADVTALWSPAGGKSLVYECAETGRGELWWWWPGTVKPLQLTRNRAVWNAQSSPLAFARDGPTIFYVAQEAAGPRLVRFDLDLQQILDTQPLERPISSLSVLGDGSVAATEERALLVWRPAAPWYRRALTRHEMDGLPLGLVVGDPAGGIIASLNHNILLVAGDPENLARGRLHARRSEDLINLAMVHADAGRFSQAHAVLDDLWDGSVQGSQPQVLIAAAQARLARLEGRWRQAEQWLGRATQSVRPDTPEAQAVWLERLAVLALDAREAQPARVLLAELRHASAEAADSPLAQWLSTLLDAQDDAMRRAWLTIGRDVRDGRWTRAAVGVREALARDAWTTTSLAGIGLILGGDLEPAAAIHPSGPRNTDAMLDQPAFQLALLDASRMSYDFPGAPDPGDLRARLLLQWVRQGDPGSARLLVREDLASTLTPRIEYCEILRQYLVTEEMDLWLQQAVSKVLLEDSIAPALAERLSDPDCRRALALARAKAALLDGDLRRAQDHLDAARTLAAVDGAELDPDDLAARVTDAYLAILLQAKLHERRGEWDETLEGYGRALDLIVRTPENWDIAAVEITQAIGLIEAGRHDPDLLQSYLRVLRGLGDPLVNPSRAPETLRAGLTNFQTLRDMASDAAWLQPYLVYSQGMCFSLLDDSSYALLFLRRAREMGASASLLPRLLLEEAALRDSLGEHELAARLFARLAKPALPVPVRALALQMQIQAEQRAGLVGSAPRRLEELLKEQDLAGPWRDWLRLQVGGEANDD